MRSDVTDKGYPRSRWRPDFNSGNPGWDHVEAESDRAQVRGLLNDLPEGQRRAIELSYFGGMSHPQIAAALGVPVGTVKGRQRLGLEKMRLALRGEEIN